MHIEEFRARLQPHLDHFTQAKAQSYARYTGDTFLLSLFDYVHRLSAGSGKRIRPYVAYLVYCSAMEKGGASHQNAAAREEDVIRFLVSLELFHLFCLVHDDVIDRGTQRYGLPTIGRFVAGELRTQGRLGDHEHTGNAQAMLLGDLLFAWSHEILNYSQDFPRRVLDHVGCYFSSMIDEVVVGQMIDVDMMTRRDTSVEVIQQKMVLKTASYTFIRPMQIGAALADASTRYERYCYDLGLSLGIAFQTKDDLLDLVATPDTTRKTLFADLRDATHTLFTQYIFEHGSEDDQRQLRGMLGADLGPQDRPRVLELFERSGALAHGQAQVESHLQSASRLVEEGPLCKAARDGFMHLIEVIRARSK
ncbi:MAG TPA: polyprenyl synthetase family protein [Abditibacteriaceae bacterium]|jgi:geranylgeranyl diphosphate synthase type I